MCPARKPNQTDADYSADQQDEVDNSGPILLLIIAVFLCLLCP
jgi:hypothetical protein